MRTSLNYLWRLLMTGLSFALFSVGGLMLTLFVFPFFSIFSKTKDAGHRAARLFVQKSFTLFVQILCRTGIMSLELRGVDRLTQARGMLILANHPTLIDVVVIISRIANADCVVKAALWDNLFLGGIMRATGYIRNNSADTLIADCTRSLNRGNNLVIFPEGTRTAPGMPLQFRRGAAHIALMSRAPILPIVLTCAPSTLTKDKRWYQIPSQRFHFVLEVGEPLELETLVPSNTPASLASRRLNQTLQQYFYRMLNEKDEVNEYAAT